MHQLPTPYHNTIEKSVLFDLENPVRSQYKISVKNGEYSLISSCPVNDVVILVCKYLSPKTLAFCTHLSSHWYSTITSGAMVDQWKKWLERIEYKETQRGPYIDFCIGAAILKKQIRWIKAESNCSSKVNPYSFARIFDELASVTASIYLNRICQVPHEIVFSIIEGISMPRKRNIAWYALADEFLKRKEQIKAKEIAEKNLVGTPYLFLILNQISL